jgi:anti-anti-sigma factor
MNENEPIVCIEYLSNATVVSPVPEDLLDTPIIHRFQETVFPLTETKGVNLVVDLTKVRSVSSSALGCLLNLKKWVERHEGRLIICCIHDKVTNTSHDSYVNEIFKVTRLESFFEICDSVERAIQKIQSTANPKS